MLYLIVSFLNGILYVTNRMTNVRAVQVFGRVNGAVINYIEATFLSLALLFLTGHGAELAPAHILGVPWWMYLCSVTGLVAMLLQIIGTLRTSALVSAALLMVGNFAGALALDYVFTGQFSVQKTVGILLVLCGAVWIQRKKTALAPPPQDGQS